MDAVEGRVVASLVEKQLTTPQQYPLTLNSLVLACNQTSNRDPVVSFAEGEVEVALSSLKEHGLVRFVLPSHGRSVVRYRHVMGEEMALDERQLALVAVLLLRGPQTAGELRARTDRMATFDSIAAVESDLEGLASRPEPVVVRLERRPGQKEERWTQLLAAHDAEPAVEPSTKSRPSEPSLLRDEVAQLRQELAELKERVSHLETTPSVAKVEGEHLLGDDAGPERVGAVEPLGESGPLDR